MGNSGIEIIKEINDSYFKKKLIYIKQKYEYLFTDEMKKKKFLSIGDLSYIANKLDLIAIVTPPDTCALNNYLDNEKVSNCLEYSLFLKDYMLANSLTLKFVNKFNECETVFVPTIDFKKNKTIK